MAKFNLKDAFDSVLDSSKKHLPDILTGLGIVAGWTAVYLFWKTSKKAEKRIEQEEEKLNRDENGKPLDIPEEDRKKLPKKDKFIIYLQYCYGSLLLGVASTGLTICANRIQAARLVEMMMLTKLVTDKNAEKKKYVKDLEEEIGEKRVKDIRMAVYRENQSEEDIAARLRQMMDEGDNRTLIIDEFTGAVFPANIFDISKAIAETNEYLRMKREEAIASEKGDPFLTYDGPPWQSPLEHIFSRIDLGTFLFRLGETNKATGCRIGELMEFRYYGGLDGANDCDLLKYNDPTFVQFDTYYKETYFKKDEHPPEVCRIDYSDWLSPTYDIIEKCRR